MTGAHNPYILTERQRQMLKMKAVVTLLVLLVPISGAQTQSTETEVQTKSQSNGAVAAAITTQLDVSAELTRLRDTVEKLGVVVVELRVEQQYSKSRLDKAEAKIEELLVQKAAHEAELTAMKTELVDLKTENTALWTEMMNLIKSGAAHETDMTVLKTELVDLKTENAALWADITIVRTEMINLIKSGAVNEAEMTVLKIRLDTSENEVEHLKQENGVQGEKLTAITNELAATDSELESLKNQMAASPKVAFSVGLTNIGYIEAGSTEMNLVFSKIFTNVGQAYSNITGFFTAPVRGVYYFRFTVRDQLDSRPMSVTLHKNGKRVLHLWDSDTDGQPSFLSSGMTLQLEIGDTVNIRLEEGKRIYDDSNNPTIFTGFLLATL